MEPVIILYRPLSSFIGLYRPLSAFIVLHGPSWAFIVLYRSSFHSNPLDVQYVRLYAHLSPVGYATCTTQVRLRAKVSASTPLTSVAPRTCTVIQRHQALDQLRTKTGVKKTSVFPYLKSVHKISFRFFISFSLVFRFQQSISGWAVPWCRHFQLHWRKQGWSLSFLRIRLNISCILNSFQAVAAHCTF